ncbi:MAG TPA: long-chain fatty acid--CoA ligase [Alphaproteobacteria bacterium]|nr:long-chain fatty acid--CoA ligase [Alphaproteobacteria bacterium]
MDYRACPNLVHMLLDRAKALGAKPALWGKRDGSWVALTYAELGQQVVRLARGLRALGVQPGDRVALAAENRPEWIVADYAIMAAGGISVPAYTTNTVADNRHIFTNAGIKGVIASTRSLAERALTAGREAPGCSFLIAIEPPDVAQNVGLALLTWDEALARGDGSTDDINTTVARLKRSDPACIIHTSGTGGLPKGVILSHGAILANCLGAYDLLVELGLEDEVFLSFLPLSHSYEHTCVGAFALSVGAQIYFAESVEALPRNMIEAKPTIMTAVPRLYETMHQRILSGLKREKPLKAKLFMKAVEIGRKRYENTMTPADRLLDPLLSLLVRSKVRARFGGRLKAFVSGGAPLSYEIGLFFTALGVRLLQGYGQTESAPVVSCNRPFRVKLDTVGPPVTDVEVRIAEDGEILVRGELVMSGYWNDEAATRAAIRDGWLHTGDVGLIDADGYIKITDRKKDFIKNAGGDMVAPARIEGLLALQPEIAQAMIYGDRKPHLVAVIVPHQEAIEAAAKANGTAPDLAKLVSDKGLRAAVEAAVARVNAQVQGHERVRRFILAREAFTIANEMMTPTLKIKRHKIREAYGEGLEALYK